jgi:hypothetical protein
MAEVRAHFNTTVVLPPSALEGLQERTSLHSSLLAGVVEQEVAVRGGACFVSCSASTFSGVVRLRRLEHHHTADQEFMYEQ